MVRGISLRLVAAVVVSGLLAYSASGYSGGEGSSGNPYQIANEADLLQLRATTTDYNKCFILTADINVYGTTYGSALISPDTDSAMAGFQGTSFTGTLDGDYHTIVGLTSHSSIKTGDAFVGLFGQLGPGGTVKKVTLVAHAIITVHGAIAGGIAARAEGAIIDECTVKDGSLLANSYIGGIVGQSVDTIISRCTVSGDVFSYCDVSGGIAGISSVGSLISQCTTYTNNVANCASAGGIAARNDGTILNSCAFGVVQTAGGYGGGIAGVNAGTVDKCLSAAEVRGDGVIGGLIGYADGGTVTSSFWDTEISGLAISSGGTGLVTTAMLDSSTFLIAGWDFLGESINGTAEIWLARSGTYPVPVCSVPVDTPVLTPGTGQYDIQVSVALTCNLTGAEIHYTTDGNDPTQDDPFVLSGATIVVDHSLTFKTRAWRTGFAPSSIASAVYSVLPTYGYSGGSGIPLDPYQIADKATLLQLAYRTLDYDKCFILTADIDLTGETFNAALIAPTTPVWNPSMTLQGVPFAGVFDGNGHKIRGLRSNSSYMCGLFGQTGPGAVIRDLTLDSCYVGSTNFPEYVGAMVAWNDGGTIERCGVTGLVQGNYYVGGLVGRNQGGTLTDCWSSASIYCTGAYAGGICGWNAAAGVILRCHAVGNVDEQYVMGGLVGQNEGAILDSYATGDVTAYQGSELGGLVGTNTGSITRCYSSGALNGSTSGGLKIGGLVGRNQGAIADSFATGKVRGRRVGGLVGENPGTVTRSYSVGAVYLGDAGYCGGLVGTASGGSVASSFWDTESSGWATSAAGTGLPTAQMQDASTFVAASWDFIGETANGTADIWQMPPRGGYPELALLAKHEFYSGGSGTAADPYQIATKADLLALRDSVVDYDKYFVMTADIDMSGEVFTTGLIAPDIDSVSAGFQGRAFKGQFDGNSHKIAGLTVNDGGTGNDFLGLFGQVGTGGRVKSLVVAGCSINGTAGSAYVGTVAGSVSGGIVSQCSATGSTAGGTYVGGLTGDSSGTVTECYTTADVTGSSYVGGFIGTTGGTISKCYSAGRVIGTTDIGGFSGKLISGSITASFWDTETSGRASSSGGTGRTTVQMKAAATFVGAGWDFAGETINGTSDTWQMLAGTYPLLTIRADEGTVSSPVFSVTGGDYGTPQTVTINCYTAGARIHYTTNGIDPTENDPVIVSGSSVTVDQNVELKAKAWKAGMPSSDVQSSTYGIVVATPVITPGSGMHLVEEGITISCADARATIHYTTNGEDPTESDPVIASGDSIFMVTDTTLKARAWVSGLTPSAVTSATYTIVVSGLGYSGGSGASGDPYQIATKADILRLALTLTDFDKSFIMTADVNMAGESFATAVIAPDTDTATADFQGTMFSGTFDGNGHSISSLSINAGATGNDYLALFGCISETAVVKNLAMTNVSISGTGADNCGAIVGWNMGIVQDSRSSGTVSGQSAVGGLVGRDNPSGSVLRSYSTANVTGSAGNVGGLAGANSAGSVVRDSWASGTVSGTAANVGGLVGYNGGTISRCYATGNVSGTTVGGLAGANSGGTIINSYARGGVTLTGSGSVGGLVGTQSSGTTNRCYSTGRVTGTSYGGLLGNASGTVSNSFWDTQTSGQSYSAGGMGRTTAQMKTLTTFTNYTWDFVGETANGTNDYWQLLAGDYPTFAAPTRVWALIFAPDGGTFTTQANVVISCELPDVTIHYTTNGVDPLETDPVVASGGTVYVDRTLTLKAAAWKTGLTPSTVKSAAYTISVATPVFTPGAGTYNVERYVVITCPTPGVTIRYTTSGVDPTTSDPVIASGASILVDHSMTLKAKAWKTGLATSPVKSAAYTIIVATPVLSPAGGRYTTAQNVVVSCATEGATIHYTLGTDPSLFPTESDPVIASGASILVDHTLILKVRAWKAAMTPSEILTGTYAIIPAPQPGSIVGWGLNDYGQATPPSGSNFTAISGGGHHSLALRADGSIIGWGDNTYGQAMAPSGTSFTSVGAGQVHSLALRADGSIVGWGANWDGMATPPSGTGFKGIAAGGYHGLALRADGSIAGWGSNTYNDYPGGLINTNQATPPSGTGFAAIAAGHYHSLALRTDGSIVCWGLNKHGQATPPSGTGFVAIAGGLYHSLALRADGSIVGWGGNTYGQATPPSGKGFKAIAAGGYYSLALRDDGSIVGFGLNDRGQTTPPSGASFAAITAGYVHGLALRAAPITPTGVAASDGTYSGRVRVSWSSANGADGYEIWRNAVNDSGTAVKIATVNGSVNTTWDDSTAVLNTVYWYWVKAFNAVGSSGWSGSDSGHTSPFTADFPVVARRRVGRTVFDYDCRVVLTNNSEQAVRVTQFELLTAPANMSIIDASVSEFDDMGAGESATSTDTCTFRVDRSVAVDTSQVTWRVNYEVIESGQVMQAASLSELDLEPQAAGDISGDGTVDCADIVLLAQQWLGEPGRPSADIAPAPDGDGVVNFLDYAVLAGQWPEGVSP